jgi:hypothetical protein
MDAADPLPLCPYSRMSDVRRAEAAARDLSQLRAELHRWIRRAQDAERMNESIQEVHAALLAERDREIARLRAELARSKVETSNIGTAEATRAA